MKKVNPAPVICLKTFRETRKIRTLHGERGTLKPEDFDVQDSILSLIDPDRIARVEAMRGVSRDTVDDDDIA